MLTSRQMGWDRLVNGDLLKAAELAGFEMLVTGDRNLEYQQDLTQRTIAIVVLTRNNWPLVRPHVAEIVFAVDGAVSGSYVTVDCAPEL